MTVEIPAGWYLDDDGRTRWWSGIGWTEHFAEDLAEATPSPASGGAHRNEQPASEPEHVGTQTVTDVGPSAAAKPEPAVMVASSSSRMRFEPSDSLGRAGHEESPRRAFVFDGGAGGYFGTEVLGFFIIVLTLGLGYPFAFVSRERWRCKHTYVDGRRLRFTGTGWGLFGRWIVWMLLVILTVGIFGFWVGPKLERWKVRHTTFDAT